KVFGLLRRSEVTGKRTLVNLGQGVMKALPVAERLVERRVEPVQEPELELIRALEQVLQFGEGQRHVRCLLPRVRLKPRSVRRHAQVTSGEPLLRSAVVEKDGPPAIE